MLHTVDLLSIVMLLIMMSIGFIIIPSSGSPWCSAYQSSRWASRVLARTAVSRWNSRPSLAAIGGHVVDDRRRLLAGKPNLRAYTSGTASRSRAVPSGRAGTRGTRPRSGVVRGSAASSASAVAKPALPDVAPRAHDVGPDLDEHGLTVRRDRQDLERGGCRHPNNVDRLPRRERASLPASSPSGTFFSSSVHIADVRTRRTASGCTDERSGGGPGHVLRRPRRRAGVRRYAPRRDRPGSRSTPMALALDGRSELPVHVVHDERVAAFVRSASRWRGCRRCSCARAARRPPTSSRPSSRPTSRRPDARRHRRPAARAARRRRAADDRPDPSVRPRGAVVPRPGRARRRRRGGVAVARRAGVRRRRRRARCTSTCRSASRSWRRPGRCRRARRPRGRRAPAVGRRRRPTRSSTLLAASWGRARRRRLRRPARSSRRSPSHGLAGARRRRVGRRDVPRRRPAVRRPAARRRFAADRARRRPAPRPSGVVEGAGRVDRRVRRDRRAGRRPGRHRSRAPLAAQLDAGDAASSAMRCAGAGDAPWRGRWRHGDDGDGRDRPVPRPRAAATEPAVARLVAGHARRVERRVAASMPMRDLEWFGGAGATAQANRGANGIDGVMSTALGVALQPARRRSPCVGDIAFVHDACALTALRAPRRRPAHRRRRQRRRRDLLVPAAGDRARRRSLRAAVRHPARHRHRGPRRRPRHRRGDRDEAGRAVGPR